MSTVSTLDHIDYSNDTATASVKGPLTQSKRVGGATGNASFGYFGGGRLDSGGPSPWNLISNVDRVDYLNDTTTALSKGPLTAARYHIAATGTQSFGYFGGGWTGFSTIDRIDYSNDTAAAVAKGPLSSSTWGAAATGNQNFGYFGGNDGPKSTVNRVDYSNDTANASTKGPLSTAKYLTGATGNADFGYFGGGNPGPLSTIDRIDYSNDTATASPKGPLSTAKYASGATGNTDFGYFGGGYDAKSTVDRIDYSNDTATASVRGPLSDARHYFAALSARANGFTAIGPAVVSNAAAIAASPNPTQFGYFVHGSSSSPYTVTVDRIDYTNDTATAVAKGSLESGVRADESGSVGNSFFGYVVGGYRNTESRISRIEYINDTATAAVKGSISAARNDVYPVGNKNFGYFAGGNTSSNYLSSISTVDRIDYSNDTGTTSVRGPLSAAKYKGGAAGNQNFGYITGGLVSSTSVSVVDRIDYSNDTATASPKGNLTIGRHTNSATGNANFGYVSGGASGYSGPYHSSIDRIDYSNDTATAAPKGPLSRIRYRYGATGSNSFGYFAGGEPGPVSSIDRVDYSNDTATAITKGPLTSAKNLLSGVSAAANALPQ